MKRRRAPALFLALLAIGCGDDGVEVPDASSQDVGRAVDAGVDVVDAPTLMDARSDAGEDAPTTDAPVDAGSVDAGDAGPMRREYFSIPAPDDRCMGTRVRDEGAVGDGSTPDDAAINIAARAAAAAGEWLIFEAGANYRVSSPIVLPTGLRGAIVCGDGFATITPDTGRAFLLRFRTSDMLIEGFDIDASNGRDIAILGQNATRITIRGNRIRNVTGTGILFRAYADQGAQEDLSIEGNEILNLTENYGGNSIQVDAETVGPPATELWVTTHTIRPVNDRNYRVQIVDNVVTGGRYGIGTTRLHDSLIARNIVRMNTRNLSMQQGATDNIVEDNMLLDSTSASIHLAYEATRNLIMRNEIHSSRAAGWGAIQLQVAPADNTITENTISSDAPVGWEYLIYAVIHASGNEISNNSVSGRVRRAHIAVESSWGPNDDPAHKNNGTNAWSVQASTDNVVRDNTITATSMVPAIYLGQITDMHATSELLNTDVVGNRIVSDDGVIQLHIIETTDGAMSGGTLEANEWDADASAMDFTLPRGGEGHFDPAQSTP